MLITELSKRCKEVKMCEQMHQSEQTEMPALLTPNDNESMHITFERWRKLEQNLCKKGEWDISKVGRRCDMLKKQKTKKYTKKKPFIQVS